MRPIQVKPLEYELTPTAGLALVGHQLGTLAPVLADVDAALPVRTGVATSDIVRSCVGLLVQGKSDFDAIENLRGDPFFKQSLGIALLPSGPMLRQRMDAHATALSAHVPPMIERLLARHNPDYGVLPCGWLPLAQRLSAAGPKAPPPLARAGSTRARASAWPSGSRRSR